MKRYVKIIGIIAVVLLGLLAWLIYTSRNAELIYTRCALDGVSFATSYYFQLYGAWPTSLQDFHPENRRRNPKGHGFLTYARTFSLATGDGWLHPLVYKPFDPSVGYGSVISYGRDGQPGGTGADTDIEVRFGEKN